MFQHEKSTSTQPVPEFAKGTVATEILGVPSYWLRDNRLKGELRNGIHCTFPPGSRGWLFNIALVRDFIQNGGNTPAHLAACQRYLESLPSSQAPEIAKKGRPRKSA